MRLSWQTAVLVLLASPGAWACGGFFCNNSAPVEQAGEHILFSVDGFNVTAHIQIQYQGEAEDFSWVLPMPSVPTLKTSSDMLFTRLRAQTDPRFFAKWNNDEGCHVGESCWAFDEDGAGSTGGDDGGGTGDPSPPSVNILGEGAVGPYDYVVVESNSGKALFDWLNESGYDQPATSLPIVEHYVDEGMVFLGLKLQKSKSTGDLQPIALEYTSSSIACIPLKLTSIAAAANMPIWTFVLADARAVPTNYFHAVMNPKAFNWMKCAQNENEGWWWTDPVCTSHYQDLVTGAANAANGRAFVTEYAGSSDVMDKQLWTEDMFDVAALKSKSDPKSFLQAMMSQGLSSSPLVREVIKAWIPKPAPEKLSEGCKTDQQFYGFGNINNCVKEIGGGWTFDPVGFADDLDERIIQPLKGAQALFDDKSYLSRLFTVMDPEEMTRDPFFTFNADLPPVPRDHTIEAKAHCIDDDGYKADEVTLTFGDLVWTVKGAFDYCPQWSEIPPPTEPPIADIQVMSETGAPVSVSGQDLNDLEISIGDKKGTPGQVFSMQMPTDEAASVPSGTFSGDKQDEEGGDTDPGTTGDGGATTGDDTTGGDTTDGPGTTDGETTGDDTPGTTDGAETTGDDSPGTTGADSPGTTDGVTEAGTGDGGAATGDTTSAATTGGDDAAATSTDGGGDGSSTGGSDSSCTVSTKSGAPSGPMMLLLVLVGLVTVRRRTASF